MKLEPVMERLKVCKGLLLGDLCILDSQALAVQQDFSISDRSSSPTVFANIIS